MTRAEFIHEADFVRIADKFIHYADFVRIEDKRRKEPSSANPVSLVGPMSAYGPKANCSSVRFCAVVGMIADMTQTAPKGRC
jgi:hypothetical protein